MTLLCHFTNNVRFSQSGLNENLLHHRLLYTQPVRCLQQRADLYQHLRFQLLLIGTVIMATGFLFETPTGVVADLYSRKLSVIIGGVLIGVCFILTGSIPLYSVALMAALIEAIGDTFVSGALDAWISDEVGADRVGQLWLRAAQLGTPAHWLGIGASILLATSSTDCLGRRVVAGCQSAAVVGDARNGLCPPADPALPRKVFAASAVAKRA